MKIKLGLLVSFILILISLGIGFLSFTFFKKISSNKNEIKVVEEKLVELRKKEAELNELFGISDKIDTNLTLAYSSIPKDPEVPFFMKQVEQAAYDSGMLVERLTFTKSGNSNSGLPNQAETDTLGLEDIGVQGTFIGGYAETQRLLKSLENVRRITNISSVKLSVSTSSKGDSGGATLESSVTIAVSAYYKNDPALAKSAGLSDSGEVVGIDQVKDFRSGELLKVLNEIINYKEYSLDDPI